MSDFPHHMSQAAGIASAVQQLADIEREFDARVKAGVNPVEVAIALGWFTQGDLARASGIEASSVTRIKQGKLRMSRQHRAAILWALAGRCLR